MFELFIFTNGIFLGVLLLVQRSELRRANVFLALCLISLSLELALDLFEEENLPFPETSFFTVPLLYFYALRIVKGVLKPIQWLWLIPGVVVNGIVLLSTESEPPLYLILLMLIPFYAFNLYLLFSVHQIIVSHQQRLKRQYTNLESRTLFWVRGLVQIFLVFHFVWILDDSLLLAQIDLPPLALLAQLLTLSTIFWVGYFGLGQRESGLIISEPIDSPEPNTPEPGWQEEERAHFEKVLEQLEQHKLYLNQELTLRLLAQQLDVNEKKLSFWINQFTENNFYHLINQYRVAEFKRQLTIPENTNFSLLGIAQNSGFRNKSTFYKVFKELEGITPNDYKKRLSAH